MENCESLLKKAILLKPQERFLLIDGLIRTIDEPNKDIDSIWIEEAEKRLNAHRKGKTTGISYEDIFGSDYNYFTFYDYTNSAHTVWLDKFNNRFFD